MPEHRPIRIVQYGLGPIGLQSARLVLQKSSAGQVELVGAVDIDPQKAGRDLAGLLDLSRPTGVVVQADAPALLERVRPDVVLHTTSSFLERVHEQIAQCVKAGAHVVSSTEELLFPFGRHPDLAAEINRLAETHGVAVLGTGVNPGFVMDTLAVLATGVCREVNGLRIERVVDASARRLPLQLKIGAGLTLDEFSERRRSGTFGHIGLRESLLFVADALGWTVERIVENLEPVLAARDVKTPFLVVPAGRVAGIHHGITGYIGDRAVLTLDLKMYVGAADAHDAITIGGDPPVHLRIENGIFGDSATVATLYNAIPLVLECRPGLRTMKDLPLLRAFGTRP